MTRKLSPSFLFIHFPLVIVYDVYTEQDATHSQNNALWHQIITSTSVGVPRYMLQWYLCQNINFCLQMSLKCFFLHEQPYFCSELIVLSHWSWAMNICVSKLTIIASDNGLSPGRCQAIIWDNAGIVSIGHLGTNFSEILIKILKFSFKKVSSAKWRPFCLGLSV